MMCLLKRPLASTRASDHFSARNRWHSSIPRSLLLFREHDPSEARDLKLQMGILFHVLGHSVLDPSVLLKTPVVPSKNRVGRILCKRRQRLVSVLPHRFIVRPLSSVDVDDVNHGRVWILKHRFHQILGAEAGYKRDLRFDSPHPDNPLGKPTVELWHAEAVLHIFWHALRCRVTRMRREKRVDPNDANFGVNARPPRGTSPKPHSDLQHDHLTLDLSNTPKLVVHKLSPTITKPKDL
mmetsp:Transcript_13471/g.29209  ORF Transcript_13471/g.29209 Transcript_13471/m.29209 type:complete len:238 (-) Transcript_13471:331-1044(-)